MSFFCKAILATTARDSGNSTGGRSGQKQQKSILGGRENHHFTTWGFETSETWTKVSFARFCSF